MTATRLYVLRHGETFWNVEGRYQGQLDSPLTDAGVAQARALAARLSRVPFAALYCSDLGRARQTAEAISTATKHSIVEHTGLRERHLGSFQGLTKAEVKQQQPETYRQFKSGGADFAPPGGESTRQMATRSLAALTEIATAHHGESIVVVTHGGVTGALLRHTLGIPLDAPRRFSRANASWNVFHFEEGEWFLETWGDTSHLAAVGGDGDDG